MKKDLQYKRIHLDTELQENKSWLHALQTKQATLQKVWKIEAGCISLKETRNFMGNKKYHKKKKSVD